MKRFLLHLALTALAAGALLAAQPKQVAPQLASATTKPEIHTQAKSETTTPKSTQQLTPKTTATTTSSVSQPAPTQPVQQPVVPPTPVYPTDHVEIMADAGVAPSDYQYVDYIVTHESGWNKYATEPTSGAYGLCQALPSWKMANAGSDWQDNPVTQMRWCNSYAASDYGGWYYAYLHWVSYRWW